jgi:hypothetical protein
MDHGATLLTLYDLQRKATESISLPLKSVIACNGLIHHLVSTLHAAEEPFYNDPGAFEPPGRRF